ncbi:MAG: hypothetical protein ACRDYV_15650, partial [Acidimicrobiia bacterium]
MSRLRHLGRHPFVPLVAAFVVWLAGSLALPLRAVDVWNAVGLLVMAATALTGYGEVVRDDERARAHAGVPG